MPPSTTKSMIWVSSAPFKGGLVFVYMLVIVQILAGNVSYASHFFCLTCRNPKKGREIVPYSEDIIVFLKTA